MNQMGSIPVPYVQKVGVERGGTGGGYGSGRESGGLYIVGRRHRGTF